VTVWLTRIVPDLRHSAARDDLRDAVAAHRRMMKLFPDGLGDQARRQAGVLYRIDHTQAGTQILVQSIQRPNTAELPNGYGMVATTALDPLLSMLDKGMTVRFRLVANATKRHGRTSPYAGKLSALTGTAAEQWWAERAGRAGLTLHTCTMTSLPDLTGKRAAESERTIRHAARRYDGIAVITDPDAARAAVLSGIGRGKSHGCGLLSLIPG